MITPEGLKVETKNTIIERLNSALLGKYPTINLLDSSPFFQRNYAISDIFALPWEVLARLIDMQFYETSEDIFLDMNLERMGEGRQSPRKAVIDCEIIGELSSQAIISVPGDPSVRFINELLENGLYRFTTTKNVKLNISIDSDLLVDDKSATVRVRKIIQDGIKYEEDLDTKIRIKGKARSRGYGTRLALKSGLQKIPGVDHVEVYVNNMDFYDENGVPAGYWHVVVSGGDDIAIADYIDLNTHDGQLLYGRYYETSQGGYVRFSRSIEVLIFLRINIRVKKEFSLTNDEIKNRILSKAKKIQEGNDVICDPYIESEIVDESGILDLKIEAKRSGGEYANIVHLDQLCAPVFSLDRIEIVRQTQQVTIPIPVWVKLSIDAPNTMLDRIKRIITSLNEKIEPGTQLKSVVILTILATEIDFRRYNISVRKEDGDYDQFLELGASEVPIFDVVRIEVEFI